MGEGMTLHRLPTCRQVLNFELCIEPETLIFAAPRRLSPWKERERPSLDQRVRTKQDWKREGFQKIRSFPVYAGRSPEGRTGFPEDRLGGQLSSRRMRKRRQSRTGHGRGDPAPPLAQRDLRPIRRQKSEALTLTQAEAEILNTDPNRSTGRCCQQSSSTLQTARFRASRQLASTRSHSPGRELFAQCVRHQVAMVATGKNVFKRNPLPCQGGRNDYFEIVKRRDQISRRLTKLRINAGRWRCCLHRP
jgi:hypothetical protein